MGTCASSEAQREAMLIDKMMEEELKKASVADEALVKLLILGAGESGKSTLFKQMKLMHGTPFTREEQHYMRDVIYENTLVAMQTLAANLPNFDIDIEVVDKAALATVLEADEDATLGGELGDCVERLWREEAIQAMWKLRGHVQIVESVVYFFEKIAELKRGDYVATVQDIMHARVRTHGIVTSKYTIKGKDYEMYDVGGQRNERRKWVNCFENVTSVLFVASLSDYDAKMFEDETTNRMKDALDLFEEVCDNRHFSNVSTLLFLNKRDLFAAKVAEVPIGEANGFPDYAGKANDYADGVRYFTDKFLRKNKDPERTIFCHVTCATDTSNVRAVMDMCYHVITQKKLESIGFM